MKRKKLRFVGKTDEEISLVCRTKDTPADTVERDGGGILQSFYA